MRKPLTVILLSLLTLTLHAQPVCYNDNNTANLCESCIYEGGFYCGDNPDNWTYYSPHGCVPDYYLNDGWEDCEDGSDEGGASPTLNCVETESVSLCDSCIEEGGFYCGDDPDNWTYYSPNGCVPDYYLNDGWEDCEDGSDEDGAEPTSDCGSSECSLNFVFEIVGQIVNIQAVEFPPGAELVFTVNGNEIESVDDAIGLSFIIFSQPVTICALYSSDDCPDGIEFCETLNLDDIFNGGGDEEGCTAPNGIFYEVGSELFLNECEYLLCEGPENWSDVITIEDCVDSLGCYDDEGNFYALGEELFFNDCEYIYCEAPNNWSDINTIEGCVDNLGCFDDFGMFYEIGSEQFISECEYLFCESPGNWSGVLEIPGCNESDCEVTLNAQELDVDNDCGYWAFWLDLTDETENIFWDFGDGNYQEGGTAADHIYDSSINNQYVVTVTILTPNCGIIFLDYFVVVDCNTDEGCYDDNGVYYSVGSELSINDCEYIYCEGPGNWSDIQVITGCGEVDCNGYLNVSPQNNGLCSWLFELNSEEELLEVFWDFGDSSFEEGNTLVDHTYDSDGFYTVTVTVWSQDCGLMTFVTDVVVIGCGGGEDQGCYSEDGIFYDLGSEIFLSDCEFIYCESPGNWSDVVVIPDCGEEQGCYSDDGVFYNVGSELFINDCEYIYCESPGNWSDVQIITGCGIDCDLTIEASLQDDVPCNLNWLFQLNGIEEETDNVFWDFGDGTTGEDYWLTEHLYETDGIYLVTAIVFTPSCQLVTVVTEIVIEGCNEQGCYSDDGVFYNIGDVLEVSDDWCENYTCSPVDPTGLNFDFILNVDLYPWECNPIWEDGCYADNGEFYYPGDLLEVSDDWCENYTCQPGFAGFMWVLNAEFYPWECEMEEPGCWTDDGVFYMVGEILEVSDDFCDNYTCSSLDVIGLEYGFTPNWEIYPECFQVECVDLGQINEDLPCPFVYAPVCGCNGLTYNNECEAFFYGGVTDWTDGPCEDGPEDCEIFFEWYINPNGVFVAEAYGYPEGAEIVWWVNGDLYGDGNSIEYNMSNTLEPLDICVGAETLDCGDFEYCETIFPVIDDFGCYEDGQFYPLGFTLFLNECEYVICEWVQQWSDVMIIDDCEWGNECIDESVIDQDMACYDIWEPVCGCDGVTYSNDCYAYYYHGVTEWTEGECGGSDDCTIEFDGEVSDGYGGFEAWDYPEGVNLHWYVNGEFYAEGIYMIELADLPPNQYIEICVGYMTEDCGEVISCDAYYNDGGNSECTLELDSWTQGGFAGLNAYDYPENANLFWMINGEYIDNEGNYLEIDLDLIDVDELEVCVGYETPECPYGVFACVEIEIEGGVDDCTLEMDGWYEDGDWHFDAYDFPEGVNLIWTVNNVIYMDGTPTIVLQTGPVDIIVCVGYETEDCGWVEVCEEYSTDGCNGELVAMQPLDNMCQWAFAIENVGPNCTVSWDFGDGATLEGSDEESHYYSDNGTYIITATYYSGGCQNGETLVITIQVDCSESSVDEVSLDSWVVFPIPTSENLTVKGLPEGTWSTKLYDATGRVVFVSDVQNGSQLDINGLVNGMYSIQIIGLTTSAKRVIVQR